MQGLFDDWQAKNITAVLHEKKGGYAHNLPSMDGLAGKAEAARACRSSRRSRWRSSAWTEARSPR